MSYPEGLMPSAFCQMEGCNYRDGGVCVNCGDRLRCVCGQFISVRNMDDHFDICRSVPSGSDNKEQR